MTVAMSRAEARRTAWGLVILNLRMKALGTGSVTDDDIEAIARTLTSPADWGMVTGCLAEIAAQGWADAHDGATEALAAAQLTALELAAGDDS